MSDWLRVAILGMVEGITEFLPVSSTGHLILVEALFHRSQSALFNTFIQTGAVLAVVVVFARRVRDLLEGWKRPENQDYLLKLGAAFLVTAIGGLILKKLHWKLPESAVPVAWATLIGGILFLLVEAWLKNRPGRSEITWVIAIAVGLSQILAAIFPGTSRSGATILAAIALGVARPAAVEFSFLLGIPTLLAAGGKEMYDALKEGGPREGWGLLALGWIMAAVTAFLVVKWLLRYVQSHQFTCFAWYRIVLGIVMLVLVHRGLVH